MGCVIYYFIEVFPGSREHRSAHKATRKLVRALQPDAELKRRAEELAVCGSIDNKAALARECVAHQMYEEAITLYESCLQGAFAKDGNLLFGLARTSVDGQCWEKAERAITRLQNECPAVRPHEVQLLAARILEGRGETDAALAAYRALLPVYVGLEARFRYGDLLSRLGQHEAANLVFEELLKSAKRASALVEQEQEWVDAARRAIVKT
jgi:hypothetical protein